ncbi:dephospho-CoA kinase [Curvibacter sp. APW13]|uniref:dephospho-CoA kinase n=1 Tax=Curvibacter sp. APW13 TaxID=3077236 RepID=UPI0028DDB098|nr:dephospho-CoA kinase [Curvibacter sp. APW13]MDT8989533.1 dephospho-CoA kinase [Curvibacter sp. APW13]
MIHLGVTGGIGSGKSTVAALLARLCTGVVLDADHMARAVTLSGGSAIPALRARFGEAIVGADGAMDRGIARQRAFDDLAFRAELEAIIHPLVQQEIANAQDAALRRGSRVFLYDIPLLIESKHWRARLDRVLVVDCSAETQMARVIQRSALPPARVKSIMQAQASRQQRLAGADLVLFNDGIGLADLEKQCQQVCTILGLHTLAKDSA